jgi:hypothetical protein
MRKYVLYKAKKLKKEQCFGCIFEVQSDCDEPEFLGELESCNRDGFIWKMKIMLDKQS